MSAPDLVGLRRLLGEALAVSHALGDEPPVEPDGVGYFSSEAEHLDSAIQRMADRDGPISMFVGAGVSMEAGLPSWEELVRRLLEGVAGDLSPEDRAAWISATLSDGPLASAAIAKALHGDENAFRRALRAALYDPHRPSEFFPGALAQQVAWLKRKLGPRLRLLTANFDGLLEAALAEAGLQFSSYVRARREPDGKAAVWHLHGRLMLNATGAGWRSDGELVLAEGDYARSSYVTWPQDHVSTCLRDSLCVFVGLSMTDPNFIRWLHRFGTDTDGPHIAIFVRQSSPIESDGLREQMERAAAARWAQAGVEPVWANYYGEVAQLVHEVGLRITDPEAEPFNIRAAKRFKAAEDLLAPNDPEAFEDTQRDLTLWLQDRVEDVRAIARKAGVNIDEEDLGLGIWAVDHDRGLAVLWGTSERVLVDKNALEERPLHVASRWVGIEAITRGTAVEQDPAVYTTRWRFIRGIPIVVDSGGQRSVVGAMTLTAATSLADCRLSVEHAPPGLLVELDRFLSDSGSTFFTP